MKESVGREALLKAGLQRRVLRDEGRYPNPIYRVPWIQEVLWVEKKYGYPQRTIVVMQQLDGTLLDWLLPQGASDTPEAMKRYWYVTDATLGIQRGLRDLHASGLVHGDIKPANVMYQRMPDGSAKWFLIDLDLAIDMTDLQNTPDWDRRRGTRLYVPPGE